MDCGWWWWWWWWWWLWETGGSGVGVMGVGWEGFRGFMCVCVCVKRWGGGVDVGACL